MRRGPSVSNWPKGELNQLYYTINFVIIFEGRLKSSQADYDAMVEFDQKLRFIFPCGPYTSSIGVAPIGFPWYIEAFILILEKVLNCRLWPHHRSDTASPPSVFFFFLGGDQEIIRWCQIRRIWRRGWSTSSKPCSRAQQPLQPQACVQELCSGETGLPSLVSPALLKCL